VSRRYAVTVHDSCAGTREVLSALLDAEPVTPGERDRAERHREDCTACQRWVEQVAASRRAFRLGIAEPVPDLTESILERIASADAMAAAGAAAQAVPIARASTSSGRNTKAVAVAGGARPSPGPAARWSLMCVAVAQAIAAVPHLTAAGDSAHGSREYGAFEFAVAAAFALAAHRPRLAGGVAAFAAVLGLSLLATSALDLAHGQTLAGAEIPYVLVFAGTVLSAIVARTPAVAARGRLAPS